MPVDKKNEKLVVDRLVLIDDSVDEMEDISLIQKKVFNALKIMLIKELDIDSEGNIKRTRKNQKAAQKSSRIRGLIFTDEYRAKVGKFIASFNTVKKMSDTQITEI